MTLTLRSASTTTATTKGAPLTHAEMDANWLRSQASDGSSLVGFLQSGSGAIAETLQSRERWVVNVTDFMSDAQRAEVRSGTVTLDVTEAWQAAHDALPSAGGMIYAPHGTHLLNKTTTATQFQITKSDVDVRGAGWGTILKHTATGVVTGNNAVVMLRPTGGTISRIGLKDFRILGPTTNTGAAIFGDSRVLGILIHDGTETGDVTDVLVENVYIGGMETACFGITSGATAAVRRVKFSKCVARSSRQDGFNSFAGNVFDTTVQDCFAMDLDGFGMEMSGAGGQQIIGNTVRRTGQSGIGIEYNSSIGANYQTVIKNNVISDITTTAYPDAGGITLGQSQNPFNTEVCGNTIFRVGGHGIALSGSPDQIDIHENVIADVGGGGTNTQGIRSASAVTNTRITNNKIRRKTAGYAMTYGVALAGAGSATNLVRDNEITDATVAKVSATAPTRVFRGIVPQFNATAVGNVGAGEDDLISESIPALTLEVDNQTVRITAWGRTAANANNKTIKLYFAGSVIFNTGALAANDKDWRLEAIVRRVNSTTHASSAIGQANGALVQTDTITGSGGADFTGATIVKCTGEATSDNDILQDGLLIEFLDTQ